MHVLCSPKEKVVDEVGIQAGQATSRIASMDRLLMANAPEYMITESATLEEPREVRRV